MKLYLIILLLFLSQCLYSQKLNCDSINTYYLSDIAIALYNNYKNHQYSNEDIECFATKLSEFDLMHGNTRILILSDMFDTPCSKCYYYSAGFETTDFGAFDVATDDVFLFTKIYNRNMEKLIPVNQQDIIRHGLETRNPVFVPNLTTNSKFVIEKISDTSFLLKLRNDTLEFLFKEDLKYLKILISDLPNEKTKKEYRYDEIKHLGAKIRTGNEKVTKIGIAYDFTDVPDNLKICWCGILEKIYYSILPLKIN